MYQNFSKDQTAASRLQLISNYFLRQYAELNFMEIKKNPRQI
jgi:hypothetical protein